MIGVSRLSMQVANEERHAGSEDVLVGNMLGNLQWVCGKVPTVLCQHLSRSVEFENHRGDAVRDRGYQTRGDQTLVT